jgi:hypothetical protein
MNSPSRLADARRPLPGRHRKPEPEPARPAPPPWATAEHAPPLGDVLAGERPTKVLVYPPPSASLPMPLLSRAPGAALVAETTHRPKPAPLVVLLGRCLQALPFRGRP